MSDAIINEKKLQYAKATQRKNVIRSFCRHRLAMISLTVLVLEILTVAILPYVVKLDPYSINAGQLYAPPSAEHILGMDDVGRDVFSRLIYGGRTSLLIGLASATLSTCIGVPMGLIAGYYGGALRMIIMRLADVVMSIPMMIAAMFIVTIVGSKPWTVVLIIGCLTWPIFCRLTYGKVISIKENEYIEAARAMGISSFRIMVRYILPNAAAPLLVAYSMSVAISIVSESSLSFLGIGVKAPQATWGNMVYLAQSLSTLTGRPWLWLPAGVCLVVTVLSINFIGDGLRDTLDPKMKL